MQASWLQVSDIAFTSLGPKATCIFLARMALQPIWLQVEHPTRQRLRNSMKTSGLTAAHTWEVTEVWS